MTQKIAHDISLFLCQKGEIPEEDMEIYQYGFEVFLDTVLETVGIIALGCILGKIGFTICFIAVFTVIRSFTGGYHADTKLKCISATLILYFLNMMLAYTEMITWAYGLFALSGFFVIWRYAPIQHANKPLSDVVKKRNKLISRVLSIGVLIGILILNKCIPVISNMLAIALIQVAILIIMGRRAKDVKDY